MVIIIIKLDEDAGNLQFRATCPEVGQPGLATPWEEQMASELHEHLSQKCSAHFGHEPLAATIRTHDIPR